MMSDIPEFMKNDAHAGKESLAEPDWWVELAYYREVLGVERSLKLLEAQEFASASTSKGWRELLTSVYPSTPLTAQDAAHLPNPNINFRALLLARALDAALRIMDAPDQVRADLAIFLKDWFPKGATKRAEAQRGALRRRGRSKHAIAKAAKYDPSVFNREVAAGEIALLDYPDESGEER
jgi:hypothetical protein